MPPFSWRRGQKEISPVAPPKGRTCLGSAARREHTYNVPNNLFIHSWIPFPSCFQTTLSSSQPFCPTWNCPCSHLFKTHMSTSLPFLEFLDSSQLPSGWSPSSLTWLMRSHMIWPEPTGAGNFEHVPDSGAQLVKASTLRPHSALRFLNSLTLLTRTLSSSLSKATADLKHQAQQNRKELLQAGCLHCQFLSRGTDWKITKKQV